MAGAGRCVVVGRPAIKATTVCDWSPRIRARLAERHRIIKAQVEPRREFAPPRKSSTSPTPLPLYHHHPQHKSSCTLPLHHICCRVSISSLFITVLHTHPQTANMVVKVGERARNTGKTQEQQLTPGTGRYQRFRPHWSHRLPQRVCSSPCLQEQKEWRLTGCSVEHQDIDIVSVNDPFIEPEYAVSIPSIL